MSHQHLNMLEREMILRMSAQGSSQTMIAQKLGRHRSTISREIGRLPENYSAILAQEDYERKREKSRSSPRLQDKRLQAFVMSKLEKGWSPEQIDGYAKRVGTNLVSFNAIYRGIHAGILPKRAETCLCRKGKPYQNRKDYKGKITDRCNIKERPMAAHNRSEVGHWEGDSVLGKQGTGGIATFVDRKSRYLVGLKLKDKESLTMCNALREVKGLPFATITVDNGNEFAGHKDIAKELGCRVYFANPYRSCERGTNENTNGRLRRYFPKGIDMRTVTEKEIEDAVAEMNDTPRKCLEFMTPKQVFLSQIPEACCI